MSKCLVTILALLLPIAAFAGPQWSVNRQGSVYTYTAALSPGDLTETTAVGIEEGVCTYSFQHSGSDAVALYGVATGSTPAALGDEIASLNTTTSATTISSAQPFAKLLPTAVGAGSTSVFTISCDFDATATTGGVAATVAELPSTGVAGTFYQVTDGASATDCITGGGANDVACMWDGAAYTPSGVAATGLANPLTADIDGNGNDLDDMGVLFLREQADANADVNNQGQIWFDDSFRTPRFAVTASFDGTEQDDGVDFYPLDPMDRTGRVLYSETYNDDGDALEEDEMSALSLAAATKGDGGYIILNSVQSNQTIDGAGGFDCYDVNTDGFCDHNTSIATGDYGCADIYSSGGPPQNIGSQDGLCDSDGTTPAETGWVIPENWIIKCADHNAQNSGPGDDLRFQFGNGQAGMAKTAIRFVGPNSGMIGCSVTGASMAADDDVLVLLDGASQSVFRENQFTGTAGGDCVGTSATCPSTDGNAMRIQNVATTVIEDNDFNGFYRAYYNTRNSGTANNGVVFRENHYDETFIIWEFFNGTDTNPDHNIAFYHITDEVIETDTQFVLRYDDPSLDQPIYVTMDRMYIELSSGDSSAGRTVLIDEPDSIIRITDSNLSGPAGTHIEVQDAEAVILHNVRPNEETLGGNWINLTTCGNGNADCYMELTTPAHNLTSVNFAGEDAGNLRYSLPDSVYHGDRNVDISDGTLQLPAEVDCSDNTSNGEVCVESDGGLFIEGTEIAGLNSVTLGTDTTGNYVATIADSGASEVTVTGSGSETAAVTLGLAASITRDSELQAHTNSTSDPTDGVDACNTGDSWLNTAGFTIFYCVDGGTDDWYGVNLSDAP